MKKVIKTIINISLSPFGLSLASINEQNVPLEEYGKLLQKYKVLIKEVHGCFSELIFSDFLPCEDRFDLIAKLVGTPVSESLYVVAYLQKSLHLDGDVCEFGVAQGATSALLANEIHKTEKRMWLFDSFKGLGKPSDKDLLMDDIFNLGSIDKYEGTMACQVDEVKSRLKAISFPLSRAKIVAGFIEETINYVNLPEKVCFAYVDFDFYKPILIALRFLNKHLSVGGVIVVDDYGFFSSGAKAAVDKFLGEYSDNYEIIFPHKFASQTTPFCILCKRA